MAVTTTGTIKNITDGTSQSNVILPVTSDEAVYDDTGKTQKAINAELTEAIDNAGVFTNEADGSKWKLGFSSDGKPGFVKVS